MKKRITRRTWLRGSAAAAATIAGRTAFPVPALLASAAPNSKLATAVIGSGGRGAASLMAAATETLVAITDVDDARRGKPTAADFQYGASITECLLLGHLAIRAGVGNKVLWDGPNMQCMNLPDLNRWVKRPCRKGWEL